MVSWQKKLEDHPLFTATRNQLLVHKFSISHYAGDVEYSAIGFVSNNTDSLPSDTARVLSTAQNQVLQDLYMFQDAIVQRQKRGGSNSINTPSFVEQMKSDMAVLLKQLRPTSAHYVRCLTAAGKERNQASLRICTINKLCQMLSNNISMERQE